MKQYSKIDTLLDRDERFAVTSELRRPVFGHISNWIVTEKVDGTNIRLGFYRDPNHERNVIGQIGGKSNNAQIPTKLFDVLAPTVERVSSEVAKILDEFEIDSITLYGEGYGAGIQKGGIYRDDLGFILFDVLVNDTAWLDDSQVTDTARRLDLERVPILGESDWAIITHQVKHGVLSEVAKWHGKSAYAEGIVARPVEPLYDRRGERIIFKLKTKDFKAGKR